MKMDQINTVCFIGAGTMGCFNSLLAALAGYRAIIFDVSMKSFDNVAFTHSEIAAFLISKSFCSTEDIERALANIILETDIDRATKDADLVSESIFERLEVKRELHAKLEKLCPPHCVITTNTSSLKVSDIESALERGDKFAALHSHLGATLIDIVAGPRTDPATTEILKNYVLSLNCVPLILKKEHPGYVLNAMLGPLLTVSMMLVIEGATDIEAVDRAWMSSRNAVMGPFGMIDLFGLDVVADSFNKPIAEAELDQVMKKVLIFMSTYIDRKQLGLKTGKGFYNYPLPSFELENFLDGSEAVSAIGDILVATLIENAILIASKDVVSPENVDLAWTVGMSLEFGPFQILADIGPEKFKKMYGEFVALGIFSKSNCKTVNAYLAQSAG